jgi:hypothetical protein
MGEMNAAIASKLRELGPQDVVRAVFMCTHCSFTLFRALYGDEQQQLAQGDEFGSCEGCGIGVLRLTDVISDQEWHLQQPHAIL